MRWPVALALLAGCGAGPGAAPSGDLLTLVADVPLPGGATRFDYQELDAAHAQLVVAHMNDAAVLVLDPADGSVLAERTGIPTPRGVAIGDGTIFVTSTPGHLVLIDQATLAEVTRVETGAAPDGDAWDPDDRMVAVSDQGAGALSLIADAGRGARVDVPLGVETGNVVYDPMRKTFWVTVVAAQGPDQLIAVAPTTGALGPAIDLPGCAGAHGLRLHPDGASAFIACETNDTLARVALDGTQAIATAATGAGPDVMALDPDRGWLYVAAESGDLTVFDLAQPGVVLVGHERPGDNAHTVAVDPATHRVFFPLPAGGAGTPVLRIMAPR